MPGWHNSHTTHTYTFVTMITDIWEKHVLDGWMDERCFRSLFCTIKAELGRGQPGLMRWSWDETLSQCSIDRSTLHTAAHSATSELAAAPSTSWSIICQFIIQLPVLFLVQWLLSVMFWMHYDIIIAYEMQSYILLSNFPIFSSIVHDDITTMVLPKCINDSVN